jgi:hypothetical protein
MLFRKSCLGKGGLLHRLFLWSTVAEGSPIGLVAATTNETAVPLVTGFAPLAATFSHRSTV